MDQANDPVSEAVYTIAKHQERLLLIDLLDSITRKIAELIPTNARFVLVVETTQEGVTVVGKAGSQAEALFLLAEGFAHLTEQGPVCKEHPDGCAELHD